MSARKTAHTKIRTDAVLLNLPEEQQLEIYGRLKDTKAEDLRKELAAEGVQVCVSVIYRFAEFWRSRFRLAESEGRRDALIAQMLEKHPKFKRGKVEEWGDALLLANALAANDPEIYVKLRLMQIRERQTEQDERKVAILEAKLDKAKGALTDGSLSPDEQNRRLREILK